ncbi:hypothetical protein FRC06_002283 [Ceratobasidium sp. 370]|nr:hypothetical protein FRC06_002283 [Ceratobasidium sp. 370]
MTIVTWIVHRYPNSDDTGEEEQKLGKDILSKDKQINEQKAQLAEKDNQLAQLTEQLAAKNQALTETNHDLADKSARLLETQDALRRAIESLAAQSAVLLPVELKKISDRLEQEQCQQKEETRNLRDKVEVLERQVSQLVEQNVKLPNNMV